MGRDTRDRRISDAESASGEKLLRIDNKRSRQMSDHSESATFAADSAADVHDRISDAVFALDEGLRLSYFNERAADAFRDPESELLGTRAWEQALDPAFRRACERAIETTEPVTLETLSRPFGGWIDVRVYPSESGVSVYCRETDREEAAGGEGAELRKRERALRRAYEIVADPERTFREQVDDLLATVSDVIGTDYATLSRVHEGAGEYVFEHVFAPNEADLEAGKTVPLEATNCERVVDTERTLVLGDVQTDAPELADRAGNAEWGIACYLGTPVFVDSEVYGSFCFYDTEAHPESFSEWDRTFVELLGNWVSYELERRRRERELEESNDRLEGFAYAVSHDLQEPLRMVTSYLGLIEGRYGDRLDEDGEEFLAYAVDGAERMREMIDGLLTYSRIETRGDPLEPVELDEVLEDVLEDVHLQLEEHDAAITTESLPRVRGDREQLRQLFQNLLSNAVAYSGDEPPRIDVRAERRDGEWVVSVSDEGIGIDPEDQERIFEVFQRLHGPEEHEGTGLGLAICERIVDRHGGEISVDSEPGEGTTFSFPLPPAEE